MGECLAKNMIKEKIFLTLPDLSLLLPTTLSNVDGGGGGGGSVDPLLTHEPLALTTSNLAEC